MAFRSLIVPAGYNHKAQCHANPELYLARSKRKQTKKCSYAFRKLAAKTQGSCATDHSTTAYVAADIKELPALIGDTVLNS